MNGIKHSIKVVSLNACLLPPRIINAGIDLCDKDPKAERVQLCLQFCIHHNVDVVLFQEVWAVWWSFNIVEMVKNVFSSRGYIYSSYFKVKWTETTNTGILVVSRFFLDEAKQHIFHASSGFQRLINNGVHHVCIHPRDENTHIHAFITHLHSYDFLWHNSGEICKKVQLLQIEEIRKFINETIPQGHRFILVGDFNSDAIGKAKSSFRMLSYCNLVQALQFGESLLSTKDFPSTYSPREDFRFMNQEDKNEQMCIDHVFTNFENVTIEIHSPEWKGTLFSDHSPIILNIAVTEN